MPRDGSDARRRLREAALDLYRDRGYDATTTAQIATRAGVTERTYFRHFADKREVLFDDGGELADALVGAVESAPADCTPLELLQRAFTAAIPLFVAGRSVAQRREAVIATAPALRERAQAKSAALVSALTSALVARGMPEPSARLAASSGLAMFTRALNGWSGTSADELERRIADAAAELRALVA